MSEKVETRQWSYIDKESWPRGEWNDEPDKLQWQDDETDLACLIVRGPSGALCGYVGVPESHPWFSKDYSDCLLPEAKPRGVDESHPHYSANPDSYYRRHYATKLVCSESWCDHRPESRIDCHGGLTFSGPCSPHKDNPEHGICRVVEGEDKTWWFGFDCAHSGDLSPGRLDGEMFREPGSRYRDIDYVRREVAALARQLTEATR